MNIWTMHLFQCFGKVLIKHLISECKYIKKYENTLWAQFTDLYSS